MEIISRSEYEENENIQHWDKIQMSSMGGLLNKKFQKKENKRIKNSADALADEIYNFFNKKLSYPLIRKYIKENGEQAIYEIFKETKDKGIGLFIYVVNKDRTKFK